MLCVSLHMEKTDIRFGIKYFHLKGLKAKEIKSELDSTFKKSSPSHTTIKRRVAEFKISCTSTEDEPYSGRLAEATTPETI